MPIGLLYLMVAMTLTGCLGTIMGYESGTEDFETKSFAEEVELVNGDVIVVHRDIVPGREGYRLKGQRFYYQLWRTTLPDGAVWENETVNVLAVDRDAISWIMVATPLSSDYATYGCPLLPYLFYRPSGKSWIRVASDTVPNNFQPNLVHILHRGIPEVLDLSRISDGYRFTVKEKRRIADEYLENQRKWRDHQSKNATHSKLSWNDPLWYLGKFSKTCDPANQDCVGIASTQAQCAAGRIR
jgi:hypothetical protein